MTATFVGTPSSYTTGSNYASSHTIPYPTGVSARGNNEGLLMVGIFEGNTQAPTTPTGWTKVTDLQGPQALYQFGAVYWKPANADTGNFTWSVASGNGLAHAKVYRVANCNPWITPVAGPASSGSSGAPTLQAITGAPTDPFVLWIGQVYNNGEFSASPAGTTLENESVNAGTSEWWVVSDDDQSTGDPGDFTVNAGNWATVGIAIAPASWDIVAEGSTVFGSLTQYNLTIPSGVAAGDLYVVNFHARYALTKPSAVTLINNNTTDGGAWGAIYAEELTGTEGGATRSWSQATAAYPASASWAVIRGLNPPADLSTLANSELNSNSSSGPIAFNAISSPPAERLVLWMGSGAGGFGESLTISAITPAGTTEITRSGSNGQFQTAIRFDNDASVADPGDQTISGGTYHRNVGWGLALDASSGPASQNATVNGIAGTSLVGLVSVSAPPAAPSRYFKLGAGYTKYVYSDLPHVTFSSDTQRFYAIRVRMPLFPTGADPQDMMYHQLSPDPATDCMLIALSFGGHFYSTYWDGTTNQWPGSSVQPPSAASGQWVWLGVTREQNGANVVTRYYDGGNGTTPTWGSVLQTSTQASTWVTTGDDYFYLGGDSDYDLSHFIAGSGLDLNGVREVDLDIYRDYVVGDDSVTPAIGPTFTLNGDAIFAAEDSHLPAGIGTNGWTGTYTAIDEGLSSPNDGDTMAGPDAGDGVTYVTMDDVEVDFVAMAEVKVTFRARVLESLGTSRFYVSAVGANELTPLSGEVQVTGLTSSFQNVTVTLPSIVAGDSSAWNGFKLKFRQSYAETYVPPSGAEWDTYPSYPVYNGVGTKTVQDYLVMDANGVFGFNDTPESGNGTLFTDGGTDPAGRTVDIVEVSSRAAMLSAIDAANGSNFTIIVLTDGEYGANIARHSGGVSNNCFNDKLSSVANLNKPIWVLAENKQAATFDQGSSLSAANRYAKGIAIALGGAADKRITGIYQTYSQNIAVEAGQAAPSYGSTAGAYSNIVIDHNRFNDMGQEGVVLRSTNGADAPNAIVAANLIEDTGNSSVLYGEGVYVGFDMPDCGNSEVVGLVIAYNEIRDWSSEGIEIKPNSKDVVIHDNYIHTNTGNVGGTDHGAFGIAIWRSAYNASPYGSAQSAVKYLDETGTAVAADGAGIRVFNNRIHSLANEDYTTGIHVGIEAELFNNRIWDIARDKGWGSGITVEKDDNAGLFDGHGFFNASYRTVTLHHNTGYNCQTGLLDTTGAHVGDVTIVASGNMADALGDMTATNNDGGAVSGDFVGPITGTADFGDGPGSGFVLAGANEGGSPINNLITHDALRAARPNDDTNDYGALELVTAAPSGYTIGLTNPAALTSSGQITATNGMVIEDKEFTDSLGDAATKNYHILIPDGVHDVVIRNCRFVGGHVDPGFYYLGAAIRIRVGCYNILVENCEFIDVARMGHTHFAANNVVWQCNYMDSNYSTQVHQFANSSGAGFVFAYNRAVCGMQRWSTDQNRDASQQDFVSSYAMQGTVDSPVLHIGNLIEGRNNLVANPQPGSGQPGSFGWGGDFSIIGAGLIGGDGSGQYLTYKDNYVASAGATQIMLGGGDYIRSENNTAFGDGRVDPWCWWSSAAHGWQGWGGVDCGSFGHASGNILYHHDYGGVRRDWWVSDNCVGSPATTPPFYTADETLTHQAVIDRWEANIDAIIDTNGKFYPPGMAP